MNCRHLLMLGALALAAPAFAETTVLQEQDTENQTIVTTDAAGTTSVRYKGAGEHGAKTIGADTKHGEVVEDEKRAMKDPVVVSHTK